MKATDGGEEPQANSLDLEVRLIEGLDVSSALPPEFSPASDVASVPGSTDVFELVDLVDAFDPDSSQLFYAIEGQVAMHRIQSVVSSFMEICIDTGGGNYNSYPMFSIQPLSGVIQVAGNLDYETKSEYNLNISVTDGTHTQYKMVGYIYLLLLESCHHSLQLSLTASSRYSSKFSCQTSTSISRRSANPCTKSQSMRMSKSDTRLFRCWPAMRTRTTICSTLSTRLLTTVATRSSPSTTAPVRSCLLSIITTHRQSVFYHAMVVVGVISTLSRLDFETSKRHEFIIKVMDDGTDIYSDFAKVLIHVTDTNDHAPQFVSSVYAARVHEMAVVGSRVIQVQATDADKGNNSQIQYSIQSGMLTTECRHWLNEHAI